MEKKLNFTDKQRGATMVEYAIMIAVIAMAVFATVVIFGKNTNALFEDAVKKYPTHSS